MNVNDYEIFKFSENIYTPFENNGVLYHLNKHPYLDIVLTDFCNQNCSFCCADLIHTKLKADLEIFKSKIKFAIENMNVKEVLLLGGEPTLSPILFDIIDYLKQFNLDKIVITTNGMRLNNLEFADKLLSSGITNINISLMSLNLQRQMEISRSSNTLPLQSIAYIHQLATHNGVKLRINNNVFAGNNDHAAHMSSFYEIIKHYCDSVKFSPLLSVDQFSVIDETSQWVSEHILTEEYVEEMFNQFQNFYTRHSDISIIENDNQFGFVKNTMIPLRVPIILNWNVGQYSRMMKSVTEHNRINNIKLLPNNELSLSWNRELDKYFINTEK